MNKITVLFIILGLLLSISVSKAYFSEYQIKNNSFKIGYNQIKIIETFDMIEHYELDKTYQKDVKIKNTGNVDCYVRVLIVCSDESKVASYELNLDDFEKIDDYYYYKKILKVNEITPSLLKSIHTSNKLLEAFNIYVYCESVQSYGYDDAYEAFKDLK